MLTILCTVWKIDHWISTLNRRHYLRINYIVPIARYKLEGSPMFRYLNNEQKVKFWLQWQRQHNSPWSNWIGFSSTDFKAKQPWCSENVKKIKHRSLTAIDMHHQGIQNFLLSRIYAMVIEWNNNSWELARRDKGVLFPLRFIKQLYFFFSISFPDVQYTVIDKIISQLSCSIHDWNSYLNSNRFCSLIYSSHLPKEFFLCS